MKKILLLGLFVALISSCGKTNDKKEEYSDNIQDTFYGVKFGANEDEVLTAFTKEGLRLDKEAYEQGDLFFEGDSVGGVSFVDFDWDYVAVRHKYNRFNFIGFIKRNDTKDIALEKYIIILSTLSKKYHMKPIDLGDAIISFYCDSKNGNKQVCLFLDKDERDVYFINLMYSNIEKYEY